MSPLQQIFAKGKAFVGYLTAGDGGVDRSVADFVTLAENGVDILEMGMPCRNPFADGPVVREANMRALAQGTTPEVVLDIAKRVRQKTSTPMVLLSYYQPLMLAGESYLAQAKAAGFDAVLVPDLPIDREQDYAQLAHEVGLDLIFMITPLTSHDRKAQIVKLARGFIYYACRSITGVQEALSENIKEKISLLREMTALPIVVGFGIGHQQTARAVLDHADGFVVGSAFVTIIEEKGGSAILGSFVRSVDPRWETLE
jgi:tryptophan synthase alpha chain